MLYYYWMRTELLLGWVSDLTIQGVVWTSKLIDCWLLWVSENSSPCQIYSRKSDSRNSRSKRLSIRKMSLSLWSQTHHQTPHHLLDQVVLGPVPVHQLHNLQGNARKVNVKESPRVISEHFFQHLDPNQVCRENMIAQKNLSPLYILVPWSRKHHVFALYELCGIILCILQL